MASRRWIEMAAPEPKREPTLCNGLVEAIAASLRSQADSHGVKLVVSGSNDDIVVRTDRKLLSRIVIGLMGDAIRTSLQGVVHVSVLSCMAEGRTAVEICIVEVPLPAAPARVRQDTGLFGLAEGQALAARLGGKVSIHCTPGEGSTHVLRIPEL